MEGKIGVYGGNWVEYEVSASHPGESLSLDASCPNISQTKLGL